MSIERALGVWEKIPAEIIRVVRMMQGRLVGQNGLAEWIQREIWPEIATLYASNGRNLP